MQMEEALHAAGLSYGKMTMHTTVVVISLLVSLVFLFLGFVAFSDSNSLHAGVLNAALVVAVTAAFMWVCGDGGDRQVALPPLLPSFLLPSL